ncbi:disease resistance protein RPS2 isoform X2 [Malania oleifera]|uniref:disease resistance protein RPS2 isoform X2 n=1 Tax=Malania oleifera TaxID=397392 RepID=UPI0025AE8BE2|nr:disease resistance protein RPS2 isoform X2 [Malania oleifera]
MDFIGPLISIVSCLCKSAASGVTHLVTLDRRVHSLATALKELKDMRDELKKQVDHAESGGLMRTNQVKRWLDRVEEIEAEVSLIVEKFGQRRQIFGCCGANCASRCKLSWKVPKKLKDVNELMDKGAFNALVTDGLLPVVVEEMPCRPSVGQEVMLEKVCRFLKEDEVGVVGVYGIGGVGKTTLLKNINNSFLTETHYFDVVIWVSISKDFVPERVQQTVRVRLGLSWDETECRERRALKIYRVLRRKKFLLLLDDVWEGFDLDEIGVPFPDRKNKCKVIFTSRFKEVCSDMDAHRKLKVELLTEKESWKLFEEKLGQREILDSRLIRTHAGTIIRKCGGLPLALITMGRAMANKESEEDWKHAIEVLNKCPLEVRGCIIEEEQLVEYWIGEGFLDRPQDDNAHKRGHDVIESLKVAYLLETGKEKSHVRMHDIIRGFALWIASECGKNEKNFLIQASAGLTEAPRVEDWEKAQRISLLDNEIYALSEKPNCPNLSTLMLQWNSGLSKIDYGFFQFMPALKVLDLSFTCLREIPATISKLVELCHLNLSGTKVTTLPKELGGLTKLRHLDLQRAYSLKSIPREAISGLSQLRVLNFYYSYANWEAQVYEGVNEVGFSDLEHLRQLTTLGITVTELTFLRRLSGFKYLLKCVQSLYITECSGLFHLKLSSAFNDGERLRRLSINNCCNFKYLAIDAGTEKKWLPSLEVLALHRLPHLIAVWKNPVTTGCLRNLRSITIWHCHKLKNISWILQLPKVEAIYLFYCKEMECVIEDAVDQENSAAFPSLRTLSIRDLPELRSISQQALAFPSLESFSVIDCPKLKMLPLKAHCISSLLTIYGNKEWWDGLQWNEASTKSAFFPHFKATC